MTNDNSAKKALIAVSIFILIIFIVFITNFIFNKAKQQNNTNKFIEYLKENNYKLKDDNSYYFENENSHVKYKAFTDNFIFSKIIYKNVNNSYMDITLSYTENDTIKITLRYEAKNKLNQYGLLFQRGTYKNNRFTCQTISGWNFDSKCDEMKLEAENFKKEIQQIEKENNFSMKYLKQESLKKTN